MKYECPNCKQINEFKLITNIDKYSWTEKLKYTETDDCKNLILPKKLFIEFNCGCTYEYKQIDINEHNEVTNIIFD